MTFLPTPSPPVRGHVTSGQPQINDTNAAVICSVLDFIFLFKDITNFCKKLKQQLTKRCAVPLIYQKKVFYELWQLIGGVEKSIFLWQCLTLILKMFKKESSIFDKK